MVTDDPIFAESVNRSLPRQTGFETMPETRFKGIIGSLAQISGNEPHFSYDYDATVANTAPFLAAQHAALTQYGLYVQMRDDWTKAVERNPEITKGEFVEDFLIFAPKGVTKEELNEYWDVLAKYSDTMKPQG
jgi:hypothetical protein